VSTEELQATLASVMTTREYFMRHVFPAAFGNKAEKLLESYYQLYGDQGFRTFVAIDDCDVAKFAVAIRVTTATPRQSDSAVPGAPRAPILIVEGSCRKLMGTLLVTCKPNSVGSMYTVFHGGEMIAGNIAPESLQMSFSPEAVRANKT
jgi:hypothetical protein